MIVLVEECIITLEVSLKRCHRHGNRQAIEAQCAVARQGIFGAYLYVSTVTAITAIAVVTAVTAVAAITTVATVTAISAVTAVAVA